MADHLNPAGVLVVEPWLTPERFVSGRLVFDSVDDPDLKVARMYVTRREERISCSNRTISSATQGVSHFTERQALGLFTEDEYRCVFVAAGLDVVESGWRSVWLRPDSVSGAGREQMG